MTPETAAAVMAERDQCATAAEGVVYKERYRREVNSDPENPRGNWHCTDGDYSKGRNAAAAAIRARPAPVVAMTRTVFQEWYADLPMQQQSVLVLACRGPDGVGKFHACKPLVARYRACVLKAAYLGREMRIDEGDNTTFMTMREFSDNDAWNGIKDGFFAVVDEIPHHYYMHLLHGAQIIGYKHPSPLIAARWRGFYFDGCSDLHMQPETAAETDHRLSDWDRKFWNDGAAALADLQRAEGR